MNSFKRKILVTGAAGFIGSAVSQKLLNNGDNVIGIDNLNTYYDLSLKKDRLKEINKNPFSTNWIFYECSIEEYETISKIIEENKPSIIINLAAQAGVRYSIENPNSYINSNIVGFSNILELARNFRIEHLIYASSSSVYGGNKKLPFREIDPVNHPISLYAATKKTNELMANAYSHLFSIPATGLRFFTVYGPWGRPDMAPMIFAKSIFESKPLKIFNYGLMKRDFTYIEDIVEAIYKCTFKPSTINQKFDPLNPDPSTSFAPHRIFNLGNNKSIKLLYFVELLEKNIGKEAIKDFQPMQPGDVEETYADNDKLEDWIDFKPSISIEEGVDKFVKWYKSYY